MNISWVRESKGKRPDGRRKHRWEAIITSDIGEMGYDGVDPIQLSGDSVE
jgi:hypothetical protein